MNSPLKSLNITNKATYTLFFYIIVHIIRVGNMSLMKSVIFLIVKSELDTWCSAHKVEHYNVHEALLKYKCKQNFHAFCGLSN